MAKQTLDLHKLYRLVVHRGGLVEVINKKQWREITKGLNLPSSITSAAFTLRTQYAKYLYPYECEKNNFSTIDELQLAIDGNRREGRRSDQVSTPPSIDTDIDLTQQRQTSSQQHQPPPSPPHVPPSMAAPTNTLLSDTLSGASNINIRSGPSLALTSSTVATTMSQISHHQLHNTNTNAAQQHLVQLINNSGSVDAMHQLLTAAQQQLQQPAAAALFVDQIRKSQHSLPESTNAKASLDALPTNADFTLQHKSPTGPVKRSHLELLAQHFVQQQQLEQQQASASKRQCTDAYEVSNATGSFSHQQHPQLQTLQHNHLSSAQPLTSVCTTSSSLAAPQLTQHARNLVLPGLTTTSSVGNSLSSCNMKITPRGHAHNSFDSSLVVSMEINGILYQGVLFAHTSLQS